MEAIGKYKVLSELGRGATGVVYAADDPFNARKVAIKTMYPDILKDVEDGAVYRKMFLNEASLAGKLLHPHIVAIYDAVVENDMSYIVMELVEGGTLEKFCTPENRLPVDRIAEIIFKCARALGYAHDKGLVHRDVKPGNILYREGTEIKIADFGAAINVVSTRTMIATVASPLYMAPELVKGARANMQTDIYSLGVVMYYLLTGRPPFLASNHASMAYQIVNHEPEPLELVQGEIQATMAAIVRKAMAKDPTERYATWDAFAQALATMFMREAASTREAVEVEATARPPIAPLPIAAPLEHSQILAREQSKLLQVSDAERFSRLQTLSFFRFFPENELWEVLRISRWRLFPAGEILIREGDIGDSFYILVHGSVKVMRGKKLLNVLRIGDSLGEMAYLAQDNVPRSATISTATACLVMKIRAQDLQTASMSCRQLFDRQFLLELVERLSLANQQLAIT